MMSKQYVSIGIILSVTNSNEGFMSMPLARNVTVANDFFLILVASLPAAAVVAVLPPTIIVIIQRKYNSSGRNGVI